MEQCCHIGRINKGNWNTIHVITFNGLFIEMMLSASRKMAVFTLETFQLVMIMLNNYVKRQMFP